MHAGHRAYKRVGGKESKTMIISNDMLIKSYNFVVEKNEYVKQDLSPVSP